MTPEELKLFRKQVTDPIMLNLFEKTQIPDRACYIRDLQISFLDGRNCGFETYIEAHGLAYIDGSVRRYGYAENDISVDDFFQVHKDCIFLSDGHLRIEDEIEEMVLDTKIVNLNVCGKLFHQMGETMDFQMESTPIEFEKMKHLLEAGETREALDDKIHSASLRTGNSRGECARKQNDLEIF